MIDNEFYKSDEQYRPVDDVKPTIEKRTKRRPPPEEPKKGRSKLKSMLTSAVIAVSAFTVATNVITATGPICTICGEAGCEFYLADRDLPIFDIDTKKRMPMDRKDAHNWDELLCYDISTEQTYGLQMSNGDRAVFGYDNAGISSAEEYYFARLYNNENEERIMYPNTGTAIIHYDFMFYDYGKPDEGYSREKKAHLQLIYAPDDILPPDDAPVTVRDYFLNDGRGGIMDMTFPYVVTQPVDLSRHLYLRAYTNVSEDICQRLIDKTWVEIWTANATFQLSDNLLLKEDSGLMLDGSIGRYGTRVSQKKALSKDFEGCKYGLAVPTRHDETYVRVMKDTMPNILAEINRMEKKAKETGHPVIAEMRRLQDFTYNGMIYQIYVLADYIGDDDPAQADITVYYVPEADQRVAVTHRYWRSETKHIPVDEMTRLEDVYSDQSAYKASACQQIMSHISIK